MGAQSDTRTWRDLDGNNTAVDVNGIPQWSEIGPSTNVNFGLPAGSLRIDPKLARSYNWEETVSIQHELFRNVSVTGGYYRRQFYMQQVTLNLAVDPERDFTPFTIAGPTHPNLPDGGGDVITLYNLNDNKRGAVNSIRTSSPGISIGSELTVTPSVAGRPLTGGIASITVQLVDPTRLYYDYVFTNDLQLSRVFRFPHGRRVRAFMEVFNLVNDSRIYTRNDTWGAQWFNPIDLVESRRFQFGAQFDL